MSILAETWNALINSLTELLTGVVSTIPGLVGAAIVLSLGYLVAVLVGWLVNSGLEKLELDKYAVQKTNLKKLVGSLKLSYLLGLLAKWYVFVLFFIPAAELISNKLAKLADFLSFAAQVWIPNAILAVLIAIVGALSAEYLSMRVLETKAKHADWIASGSKLVVWVFTVLVVLSQIGVQIALAQQTVLLLVAGLMLGMALALGIGFGLALKDEAKSILKSLRQRL
ncbi:hypothetical protein HYV79_01420 [Candidatus Woesearchaeota archaeon]|nr:hypothetical protein [Candidatus Woesearchaeota archaeon]